MYSRQNYGSGSGYNSGYGSGYNSGYNARYGSGYGSSYGSGYGSGYGSRYSSGYNSGNRPGLFSRVRGRGSMDYGGGYRPGFIDRFRERRLAKKEYKQSLRMRQDMVNGNYTAGDGYNAPSGETLTSKIGNKISSIRSKRAESKRTKSTPILVKDLGYDSAIFEGDYVTATVELIQPMEK